MKQSLWAELVNLIGRALGWMLRTVREVPAIKWVLLGIAGALVAGIIGKAAYASRARRYYRGGTESSAGVDPWVRAREAAAAGRFVEAAHLLYLALIEAVALRERLRLHPAKTIGDYTRDLRRSTSPVLPVFREFARIYEPIVWGSGECDRAAYERLKDLTESVRNAA